MLLLVAGSSTARATSFHWKNNSVGGLYSDPNNWVPATGTSGDGPPKAGDDAGFPGQTVQFKAGDASATAVVGLPSTVFDLTSGGYNVSGAVTIRNNAILTVYGTGGGAGNILAAGSIVFDLGQSIEIDSGAQFFAGSICRARVTEEFISKADRRPFRVRRRPSSRSMAVRFRPEASIRPASRSLRPTRNPRGSAWQAT